MDKLRDYIVKRDKNLKLSDYIDINEIPVEDLESQLRDFRIMLGIPLIGKRVNLDENSNVIIENVSKTEYAEKTVKEIQKLFSLKDWQVQKCIGANSIDIVYILIDYADNKELFINAMSNYGWHFTSYNSQIVCRANKLFKMYMLHFDPMYQNNVNSEVKKSEYLYHISPEKYKESILNKGLVPKSENRLYMYPNRIHLIKDIKYLDEEIISLGKSLYKASEESNPNYIVYKICIDKLPNNIDFYYDPRYENGYYTKDPISKEAIEIYGTVNLETDEEIHHTNISF